MAQNVYRTAQGQAVNIDQMRILNEKSVTVGNTNTNARGDEVLPNGEIIKPRSEIMKERYKSIGPVTKYNPHKYTSQVDQTVEKLAEVVTEAPVPNTDLRGSLASTMSIDLTEEPTQTTRTITRI